MTMAKLGNSGRGLFVTFGNVRLCVLHMNDTCQGVWAPPDMMSASEEAEGVMEKRT